MTTPAPADTDVAATAATSPGRVRPLPPAGTWVLSQLLCFCWALDHGRISLVSFSALISLAILLYAFSTNGSGGVPGARHGAVVELQITRFMVTMLAYCYVSAQLATVFPTLPNAVEPIVCSYFRAGSVPQISTAGSPIRGGSGSSMSLL